METKKLLNKKITQWLLLVATLVGCSANVWASNEYNSRYIYIDCTSAPDPYKSTLRLAYYWKASCDEGDGSGSTDTFSSAATNIFYYDLNNFSTSYSYLRSFKTAQGSGWWDQACLTPSSSGHKNNCIKITNYGTQSWSTYVLTPSNVSLSVSKGASSGSGTSQDPYIVEPGAKFTLSASDVTFSPADPNMKGYYYFGTSSTGTPNSDTSSAEITASSTDGANTQYYVIVKGKYNNTTSSSTKSASVYVKTVNPCTAPTATQYPMTNATKTYGSVTAPTITPATGAGTVETVYYTGVSPTSYSMSSNLPTNAGTYKVTVDVNAGSTYCAKDGIELSGNFVISKKTPAVSDFDISIPTSKAYDGKTSTATITAKSGISGMGTVTVKYNGSTTAPSAPGTYPVTFDVAAGTNYSAATGLSGGGNVVITKANQATLTISNTTKEVCNNSGLTLTTSGGSGTGAVTYQIVSGGTGAGTISGSTFTGTSAGTVLIKATKAADANYKEASSSNTEFTVNPLNNVSNITFSPSSVKKGETTQATATVTTDGGTGAWSPTTSSLISFTSTSANPTTISANGIGTAKVTYTLTNGCNDTSKGAVNSRTVDLVINSDCDAPDAGTISGTTAICAGGSVSLSVSGYTSTNTALQWNKNGSPVAGKTSNTYTESNVTESATYTVTVTRTDVDNCSATTPTGYEVTVTQIPSIATHTDGSRCGAGTVELQATASAGDVKWYAASTGGDAITTGTSYTPNVSATTTYYVDATQNNCTTATRTAVTATVKSVPSIGSISKSADECGAGDIYFQANTVTAGATVTWYENSAPLAPTGTVYTFTDVPAGTSHTVKAKASKDGCESGFTSELTGTRKAVPTLNIGLTSAAITDSHANSTYGWEAATFTATSSTDGATVTGGITQTTWETAGKDGIINGNTAKGHVGDAFTGSYTATGSNGCTTSDSKTVTVIKATESCD